MADFYDAHGDAMVECVRKLVASHECDCIVVGSLIFFLKWLRTLGLPLVHTRFSPYAAKEGDSTLQAHANDVCHFLSIARSFGLTQAVAAEAALPDQDLLGAIKDMKRELTLLAYADGCEGAAAAKPSAAAAPGAAAKAAAAAAAASAVSEAGSSGSSSPLPGLPMLRTGFWLTPTPSGYTPPADLETFLAPSAFDPHKPVCLNFGSMAVYEQPWAADLFGALQSCGRRIVAVGSEIPLTIREWANVYWIKSVPHAYLFPHCGCVIHHGGAGTTAACASAGAAHIVVPFLGWSDQPRFATWVGRTGAGVHIPPQKREFETFVNALKTALSPAVQAAAAALSASLAQKSGVATAVDAIEDAVGKPPPAERALAMKHLDALATLPLSEGGKLRAGLYCLLHEPTALPLQTYEARDTWLKALGKTIIEFPLYKPDWPPRHKELDLALHDLPHASSLIEWWYFHAHLTASDGTPYCIFVALFQLKLGGETLSHVHASLLINGERHVYYTAGEPHASATVMEHRHPKHDEYFERALLEVMAKKNLPLPDVVSPVRFDVPADKMDFDCHRMTMSKDEQGRYHVSVKPTAPVLARPGDAPSTAPATSGASTGADGFGFDLTFTASKPAVSEARVEWGRARPRACTGKASCAGAAGAASAAIASAAAHSHCHSRCCVRCATASTASRLASPATTRCSTTPSRVWRSRARSTPPVREPPAAAAAAAAPTRLCTLRQ